MLRVLLALVVAVSLLGAAQAAEIEPVMKTVKGAITAVNEAGRTVTINGVTYTFPQAVNMAGLAAGQTVTITYDTAAPGNVVSKVAK